jgi:hypothetical protein
MNAVIAALALVLSLGCGPEAVQQGPSGAETVGAVSSSTVRETGALRPSGAVSAHATYYCLPRVSRCTVGWPASCLCAAISPDLRRWAGSWVRVIVRGRSVRVRVIDCNCQAVRGIDLYAAAFRILAPLAVGRMVVTLTH